MMSGSREAPEEVLRAMAPDVARVLVDNHREFLRFLERRVGRREVAEDILQEAFARGLGKLDTLRNEEAVVPWFYRTLRNATIDYHRRAKVVDRALDDFAREVEAAESPTPDTLAEVCRCVTRLAETLKPEYAEALRALEVDGVPLQSFAEQHGISRNNAAVRVFRARDALRRQVAASCGSCAEHGCLSCTCDERKGFAPA